MCSVAATPYHDPQTSNRNVMGNTRNTFSPRCLDGPDMTTYCLGGVAEFVRPRETYLTCLREIQSFKKTMDEDFGRLLCLALVRKEFSKEDIQTKNVTGVSKSADRKTKHELEKLDAKKLKAIFNQARIQFPGFNDNVSDTKSKTVIAIQDMCKRARMKARLTNQQ